MELPFSRLSGVRSLVLSGGGRQDGQEPRETPIYGPGLASTQGQGQPTRRMTPGRAGFGDKPSGRSPPAGFLCKRL